MAPPTHHNHIGAGALGGANNREARWTIVDAHSHIRPPAYQSFGGHLGGRSDSLLKPTLEGGSLFVSPGFA
jgi:hypothetical protein